MPASRVHRTARRAALLLLLLLPGAAVLPPGAAWAQAGAGAAGQGGQVRQQAGPAEARRMEDRAAWDAALDAAIPGPAPIRLLDQAVLHLPSGMVSIPRDEAARLMRASGNQPGDDLVGLVTTTREEDHWNVVVRFARDGHVRDDDAKDWNADALLAGLRRAAEADNRERARRGFPEVEPVGWIAPPRYDPVAHQLAWSVLAQDKGARAERGEAPAGRRTVNYNTRALGRDGYFSLNLITDEAHFAADRTAAAALLGGLSYVQGKRYADFVEASDRVAGYGLAGLVGVPAAGKPGPLAAFVASSAKFAKEIAAAAVVLAATAMWLLRRRLVA